MKNLLTTCSFALILVFTVSFNYSCNKVSCTDFESFYILELADERGAYSDASTTYSQDQSDENCDAYKEATTNLRDELDAHRQCYDGEELETIDNEIDTHDNELSTLDC